MKLHAPLLPLAFCLMIGIGISGWIHNPLYVIVLQSSILLVTALLHRHPQWQRLGISCCTLMAGMLLGILQNRTPAIEWPQESVGFEGIIVSEPIAKPKVIVADIRTTTGNQKIRCRFYRDCRSEKLSVGNGVYIQTYIYNKVRAKGNGHFDYQRHMQIHGITGEAFVSRNNWIGHQVSLSHLSVTERVSLNFLCWRHRLLSHIKQWNVGEEVYSVIAAMSLGEKSSLDKQLKDTYAKVGASHILALSGLHLGIIYTIVTFFLGWHRFRTVVQMLTVLAIWAFAFLVGLPPSVIRSASMISIYALLTLGYRERMSVNTLAFVAIVMLIINPLSIYDIGFQLSFMAVLSILLFMPLFNGLLPPHIQQCHRWLSIIWGTAIVSISAQIGTAPLLAYYFERFSTWFLLSNFVVIPLAFLILYLTLFSLLVFWWSSLQQLLVYALSLVVLLQNKLLTAISAIPLCTIEPIRLTTFQLAMIYIIITCIYILFYQFSMSSRAPKWSILTRRS